MLEVLHAAGRPMLVPVLRTALAIDSDTPRPHVSAFLTYAVDRGGSHRTGQRRGTRYSAT